MCCLSPTTGKTRKSGAFIEIDTTSLRPVGRTEHDYKSISVVKSQGKFYDARTEGIVEEFVDLLSTLEYLLALRHVKHPDAKFVRPDGTEIKAGDME